MEYFYCSLSDVQTFLTEVDMPQWQWEEKKKNEPLTAAKSLSQNNDAENFSGLTCNTDSEARLLLSSSQLFTYFTSWPHIHRHIGFLNS